MKICWRIAALSLFLALCCVANAGLGETMEQTIQRYGQIVKREQSPQIPGEAGMMYEFQKSGFRIQVRFVSGRVAWILYMSNKTIFTGDIITLLDNNAEGSKWSEGSETKDSGHIMHKEIHYARADGLADADYQELGTYYGLSIITKAWRRARSPETNGL